MYAPKITPQFSPGSDTAQLSIYVVDELRSIAAAVNGIAQGQYLQVVNVAPSKPKEPQIAFADGTNWNPGSGKGLYVYYNSAWHFAG